MKKIVEKYRSLSPAVKASFWFAVSNFLQRGISMLTTPIFTRVLTTEDFGTVSLYQSWNNLFIIVATLNLSGGVFNNGMVKYKDDKDEFTSSIMGLSTCFTLLILLIVNVFSRAFVSLTSLPIYILDFMLFSYVFMAAQQFWTVEKRFQYDYKPVILITFLNAFLTPTVSLIAIFNSSRPAEARILSIILVQVLLGIGFFVFIFKRCAKPYNRKYWAYALGFNIPLIPHYLSNYVLSGSDRIMIEKMCGVESTALYSLGYTLATVMYLVTGAINNSFIPWTYQKMKNGEYKKIKSTANQLVVAIGLVCICMMLFAPEIVWIMGSEKYRDAVYVIPPVAASVLFTFIYSLFGNIQFYFENTGKVAIASTITAISNILLNAIFIRIYGYVAAAYTTLFCYALYALIHYLFMKRECKKRKIEDSIYDIRLIVGYSAVVIITVILASISYNHRWIRLGLLVVVSVVLVIVRKKLLMLIKTLKK